MSYRRAIALLAVVAAVGLGLVSLRAEQTRCAAEMLKLESRRTHLRREWSALQARAARLRAPERIAASPALSGHELASPGDAMMTAMKQAREKLAKRTSE